MKEARYFLVVRFSVESQAEAPLLRRLVYGIESRAAFEACEGNKALKDKFARERAPFGKHMRVELFCGELEAAYAA